MKTAISVDNIEKSVEVRKTNAGFTIQIDDRAYDVTHASLAEGVLTFFVGDRPWRVFVSRDECGTHISLGGRNYLVWSADDEVLTVSPAHHHSDGTVEAPMPGNVAAVNVRVGDRVSLGDPVVSVESMKMHNEITSPVSGEVKQVHCAPGDQVSFGEVLVEIEPQ